MFQAIIAEVSRRDSGKGGVGPFEEKGMLRWEDVPLEFLRAMGSAPSDL